MDDEETCCEDVKGCPEAAPTPGTATDVYLSEAYLKMQARSAALAHAIDLGKSNCHDPRLHREERRGVRGLSAGLIRPV
jgi:hypothetical protein